MELCIPKSSLANVLVRFPLVATPRKSNSLFCLSKKELIGQTQLKRLEVRVVTGAAWFFKKIYLDM